MTTIHLILNLATVITNLLSAIPVFGKDIVELKSITEYFICFVDDIIIINKSLIPILSTVGTVSIHALKKEEK